MAKTTFLLYAICLLIFSPCRVGFKTTEKVQPQSKNSMFLSNINQPVQSTFNRRDKIKQGYASSTLINLDAKKVWPRFDSIRSVFDRTFFLKKKNKNSPNLSLIKRRASKVQPRSKVLNLTFGSRVFPAKLYSGLDRGLLEIKLFWPIKHLIQMSSLTLLSSTQPFFFWGGGGSSSSVIIM